MGGLADFFSEGVDRIGKTAAVAYRGAIPANARVFGEVLAGRNRPITDGDFSTGEMDVIRKLAASAEGGVVNYDTYARAFPESAGARAYSGLAVDPVNSVKTTLGQFRATPTADGFDVADTYDFNPIHDTRAASREAFVRAVAGEHVARLFGYGDGRSFGTDAYGKLRLAGEAFGPRGEQGGEGVPVRFSVPPK